MSQKSKIVQNSKNFVHQKSKGFLFFGNLKKSKTFSSNKKALAWSMLGRIILVMAILLILLIIVSALTGKMDDLWERIMNIFRFGG